MGKVECAPITLQTAASAQMDRSLRSEVSKTSIHSHDIEYMCFNSACGNVVLFFLVLITCCCFKCNQDERDGKWTSWARLREFADQ